MFERLLHKCATHETLTEQEAYEAMNAMMGGEVDEKQVAAFLALLRFRGETVDELVGFIRAMHKQMRTICFDEPVIDTCGTGGDGKGTFNISTAVALLVASLDIPVAKHGNRAVSSTSGSANVIEHFLIPMPKTEEEAKQALRTYRLVFLFAPFYHEAMKYVAPVRQSLKMRTTFNLLGPLVNPARPKRQVIGVHNAKDAMKMAEALQRIGTEHTVFVTSYDGLDECSIASETQWIELKHGRIIQRVIAPDTIIACVGGGSNAIGMFHPFLEDDVECIGVEAAGKGVHTTEHAATITKGKKGVIHGSLTYVLQDEHGQITEPYSISAGLDYPGVGPEHAYLAQIGRVRYESVTDEEAIAALQMTAETEGIIPAIESAHALAKAFQIAPLRSKNETILVCLSGRGDKDVQTVMNYLEGDEPR